MNEFLKEVISMDVVFILPINIANYVFPSSRELPRIHHRKNSSSSYFERYIECMHLKTGRLNIANPVQHNFK